MKTKLSDWVLVLSCFILVSSTFVLSVDSDNPSDDSPAYDYWYAPENSFGISETKTINWSYFKSLFLAHTDWMLEYKRYSYSSWTDGDQYLTIERTWNDSGFWKFNLILDVPVNVYSARFTFGIDLPCLQYIERDGYEIWINYSANATEDYSVMFNWSDIASIPNIVISKGRTNDMFWFRFRRDNIPSGHYEFDPTFGSTDETPLADLGGDWVRGLVASPASDGTADSISMYISTSAHDSWVNGEEVKGILYWKSNYTKIKETEELTTGGSDWFTFDFDEPKPSLSSAIEYIICVFNDDGIGFASSSSSGTDTCVYEGDSCTYPNPASPLPSPYVSSSATMGIYCSYTEDSGWSNTCPVSSAESPTNKSTDVSVDTNFNVTINDADGNNTWGNITCSNSDTVAWSNQANGSRSLTITDLDYSTNYTVWVNYTDVLHVCDVKEYFWFITEDAPWSNTCPVSSGLTIANGSCCNALNLSWNITISDADGNTTSGTIFNSDGQNMSWSAQANGTRSLSLVNLTCETNYTIWVNYTDALDVCSENESYWFVTEDCPESGVCNCSDFFNETELYAWLNSSGFMDMSDFMINPVLMAIVLMLTFFVLAERKEDYLLYVLSGILAFVMGVYYIILLEGISYTSWIGVILLLFGVYCFFLSLAYSLKKRSRK